MNCIPTAGLDARGVIAAFESVVLTKEEEFLLEALRTIEPRVIRLASIGSDAPRWNIGRGGIVIRLSDSPERIPIGSLGDGMWRILGIALALVSSRNGVLLVDEIDTGLHYTALENMWRVIDETSKRLNIQVFATTHSRDCYESLASICREDVIIAESEVLIHRIESGSEVAISYSEGEIISTSLYDTEVR